MQAWGTQDAGQMHEAMGASVPASVHPPAESDGASKDSPVPNAAEACQGSPSEG